VGISKIAYADEQVSNNAMGAGSMPVGIEGGNYSASASFDLFKEEVRAIQTALPAGVRMQDIQPFDILVSYAIPGGGRRTDVIHNCRFLNNGVEVNQGDGKIVRSFNMATTHISHNI
jgi:hypothetical protein